MKQKLCHYLPVLCDPDLCLWPAGKEEEEIRIDNPRRSQEIIVKYGSFSKRLTH